MEHMIAFDGNICNDEKHLYTGQVTVSATFFQERYLTMAGYDRNNYIKINKIKLQCSTQMEHVKA